MPFLEPVNEEEDGAPDYYASVDDPIDMQTIEFKLRNNIYQDYTSFHADMRRMWSNARLYNNDNPFMLSITESLAKRYSQLSLKFRPSALGDCQ
jgi:hypothetical protein